MVGRSGDHVGGLKGIGVQGFGYPGRHQALEDVGACSCCQGIGRRDGRGVWGSRWWREGIWGAEFWISLAVIMF